MTCFFSLASGSALQPYPSLLHNRLFTLQSVSVGCLVARKLDTLHPNPSSSLYPVLSTDKRTEQSWKYNHDGECASSRTLVGKIKVENEVAKMAKRGEDHVEKPGRWRGVGELTWWRRSFMELAEVGGHDAERAAGGRDSRRRKNAFMAERLSQRAVGGDR